MVDSRIVVIPTDGGEPRRLPSGYAFNLDWSPRGDEIAYGGSGDWIVRTDGSKPRPLFRSPPRLLRPLGYPIWSPDATHVGFVASVQHGHGRHVDVACGCSDRYDAIYVSDADGSNLHLVTSHAYNEYGFAWSPDGRSILYGRANRGGIYGIGADGRNNHRLTRDSPTPTEFPALTWAPDGRSIAYETDRTGNGDIYIIGADGHNKVRLTNSAASDGSPSWEPR
jgi:TolB protein